jgi:hypothetical protein
LKSGNHTWDLLIAWYMFVATQDKIVLF